MGIHYTVPLIFHEELNFPNYWVKCWSYFYFLWFACPVCRVYLHILEPSSPNKKWGQEMIVHTIGNNRGHGDSTCTRLWVKWLYLLPVKICSAPEATQRKKKACSNLAQEQPPWQLIYRPTEITHYYVCSWKLQLWIDGSISLFCQGTPCLLERW